MKGWFDGFRDNGWNTYYGEQRTAVWGELSQVVIIFCSVVLAASLLVIVLGTRGKERWCTFLKLIFNLHIGVVILVTVTGKFWQLATVNTFCDYYISSDTGLDADIGILVGLKSINITLDVDDISHSMLEAKRRGLPAGILYVLEYFAFDGGGLRWTRVLRLNGHFVFILLWSALVSWLLACAMLIFVTTRGALLLVLTGALMFLSCVTYHANQPKRPLVVPFEDTQMELRYGWCFWLCGISGLLTMLAGVGIVSVMTWCSETTCILLLGCGRGEDDDDMYDLPPVTDDGPLVLDTPFQERKKSVKYYQNSAFEMEDGMHQARSKDTHLPPPDYLPVRQNAGVQLRNGGVAKQSKVRQVSPVAVLIDSSDEEPPPVAPPDFADDDPGFSSDYLSPRGQTNRSRDHSPAGSRVNDSVYSSSFSPTTGDGQTTPERGSDLSAYSTPEAGEDFPESIWRREGTEDEEDDLNSDSPEVDPTDEDLSEAGWTHSSPETLLVASDSDAGQSQLTPPPPSASPPTSPTAGNCKTVIDLENNEISYSDRV